MLEKFINGQDVFLFQPTGLGKFESFGSRTSDNKVNRERDTPKHRARKIKQSRKQRYYLL